MSPHSRHLGRLWFPRGHTGVSCRNVSSLNDTSLFKWETAEALDDAGIIAISNYQISKKVKSFINTTLLGAL